MNRVQNQKLKRLLSVNNHLSDNAAVTATLLNVAVWQPQLDTIAADIIKHAAVQATSFAGSAQAKAVLKAQLADEGFFIAACAKAYARSVNDTVLYQKVEVSASKLKSLNDTDLLNTANIIYTAVNAHIADISAVTALTAAQLATLLQHITAFTKYIPQAKAVRGASKIHTQAIVNLLAQADTILDEAADYVELTRFSNPTFYQGYTNANKIGNAITRNRALQINVSDKTSQMPVFKADITITDLTGKVIATKKTTAKGNAYLQDLKEQDYQISIVQAGYTTYTTTVSITDGTTLLLPIELEIGA
jgi:hypothetical protein